MHEPVRTFMESVSEAFGLREPIYEFGYDPGAGWPGPPTPRSDFPEQSYLACEPSQAAEIDRLEDLARLPFPDAAAKTVIAVGVLEHVFEPRRAAEEMVRILAPGGLLVLCSQSRTHSPESPNRYWQPTPRAIQRLLAGLEATVIGWQGPDHAPHTLFGIASKSPMAETFFAGAGRFLDAFQKRLDAAASQTRLWPRLKRRLIGWARGRAREDRRLDAPAPKRRSHSAGTRKTFSVPSGRGFYNSQFVLHLPVPEQLKHRLLAQALPEENTGSRLDTSR